MFASKTPDHHLAADIFYAVPNFRDKLAMVNAAVERTYRRYPDVLTGWHKLREQLRKRSLRRNQIAHSHSWVRHTNGGTEKHQLGPPIQKLVRLLSSHEADQKHFLTTVQLGQISDSFLALAKQVIAFSDALPKEPQR